MKPTIAKYVDTPDALAQLCAQLQHSEFIALDTEFVRERTYLPRLCLVQVATPTVLAIVDPLALPDLSALWQVVRCHAITKVLHAARQDLEIFYEHYGIVTTPLFDTQLAATLLGHGDQIGYGALVELECGVTLDKAHTRTDWVARPLDAGQLCYAADDVRYLVALYPQMKQKLVQDGRLDWLTEDCAMLANPVSYGTVPVDAWKRVHGVQTLSGSGRALLRLQRLAAWREQQARTEDRPRRWIVSDEVLLELARQSPQDLNHLRRIRGLDADIAQRYGQAFIALLCALAEERTASPITPPLLRTALSQEQHDLVDRLLAVVNAQCTAYRISVATLTSRRDLEALVMGKNDIPLLHGWRRAFAGQKVLDTLRNR